MLCRNGHRRWFWPRSTAFPTTAREQRMSEKNRMCQPDLDATIRRMACAGYSDAEIGRHIGRDRQYVGRRRREIGIDPGQSPALRAMVARLHWRRRCGRVTA